MFNSFLKKTDPVVLRNILFTVLAVGFALGLYSCATKAQKREAARQLLWNEGVVREWRLDGQPVIARVKIPEKYKSMPIRTPFFDEVRKIKAEESKGKVEYKSEYVKVLWPNMKPSNESNADKPHKQGWGQKIHILLVAYPDIAENYPYLKESYYKSALGFSFGRYDDEAVVVGQQYGLTVVDLNAEKYQELQAKWEKDKYDDYDFGDKVYFFKNKKGGFITVIRCARLLDENVEDGRGVSVPYPACSQYFYHQKLSSAINVNYGRKNLKDWKKIQTEVTELLDSFIVEE